MNTQTLTEVPALILPGILIGLLPFFSPRRHFFGITVAPGFPQSEAGRAIRRGYSLTVIVALSVAVASLMAFPQVALPAALFVPPLAAGVAFFYARSRVAPYAVSLGSQSADAIREAEISRGPESLPRWTLLALPPFAVPIAVAFYLRTHWDEIPERFPVHFGLDGRPNRWVSRTPHGVYGPLWFGVAFTLLLILIGLAAFYGSRRSPLRRGMLKIMIAVIYLISFIFGMVGLLPIKQFSPLAMFVPLSAFVVAVLVYAFKLSSDPDIPGESTPDACWRFSEIYYNPADPAIFVQKRVGVGYTLNFGNRLSWALVAVMLGAITGMVFLLR